MARYEEPSLKISYLNVKEHLEEQLEDRIQQKGIAEGEVQFDKEMQEIQTAIDVIENLLGRML